MAVGEFNRVGKKETDFFHLSTLKREIKTLIAGATTLSSLPLPPYLHLNNSVLKYRRRHFTFL